LRDSFERVWDFDSFSWQQDLVRRLATGKDPRRNYADAAGIWPDVLDLPTGSGKTSALDIAVFHLALEALKKGERRAPVRVAFVVDRRLIIDDAFERAKRLCDALAWALLNDEDANELEARAPDVANDVRRVRAEPIVKRVALRLRDLAGPNQPPLLARALRGGTPREDDWARTPVQPTILCSTVDQVGSRLLFRGYGISDCMKPIHAGLLGSDCLILLDEPHLSEPFRQTLKAITSLRAPDVAPFGFALLTATPNVDAERPFGLSADDYSNPILSARILASKPASLVEITGEQGIDTEARRIKAACNQAQAALLKLKKSIANPAVGVVVNRVARARAVFERLCSELGSEADVTLIIGSARAVERDNQAAKLSPIRTRHPDAPRTLEKPLIAVATQTIEAGVDIDFDGLVTEAASLDALRQRFGRVNRGGRKISPEAVILVHKDDIGAKVDDPVYGARIKATWEKMQQLASESNNVVDFGIDALRKRINRDEAGTLAAPIVNAPILLPAYADLWSQTWPIPNADPDVVLFLHGPDHSPATVQILWRADLDEENDLRPAMGDMSARARLMKLFTLLPPRAAEAVEVPLWAARAWLERSDANAADFSDAVERPLGGATAARAGRRAFRWAGEDSERTVVVHASALRNGDLIVVPSDYGGCDKWGWNPNSNERVIDVTEKAAWPYRARRFAVRVTPALIAQEPGDIAPSIDQAAIAEALSATLAEHEGDRSADDLIAALLGLRMIPIALKKRLEKLQPPEAGASEQRERRKGGLNSEFGAYRYDGNERPRGVIFAALRGLNAMNSAESEGATPATESDELSASGDRPVTLLDHSEQVRDWALAFSEKVGLPKAICEDIGVSAFLHDPGKADPRCQAYYAGGDPYGPDPAEPLAKSGQRRLPRGARERAGLPPDWRHEALSVRLAIAHPNFRRASDSLLVLWLIGTHHGYGRPLFPHADALDVKDRCIELPGALGGTLTLRGAPGPQSLAFDFEGLDWAQIFAILKTKYGIWGLARLEAFVRLADHRASEEGVFPQDTAPYKQAAE
jgi:CRISPR-associated endonuclease/helicase Cas3